MASPKREDLSLVEQPVSARLTHQEGVGTGTIEDPQSSDESHDDEEESAMAHASAKRSFPKSKRNDRTIEKSADDAAHDVEAGEAALIDSIEGLESNEDDAAPEEVDDAAEADIAQRDEEICECTVSSWQ